MAKTEKKRAPAVMPKNIAPPYHLEAEKAVLGAMLSGDETLDSLLLELSAEDFYGEANMAIFTACQELATSGMRVDSIVLSDHLQKKGELEKSGGMSYLAELASELPTLAGVNHYVSIVKEKSRLRKLLQATFDIQMEIAQSGEFSSAVEVAEKMISGISEAQTEGKKNKVSDFMQEIVEDYERRMAGEAGATGLGCHFDDLMWILGGFRPGELIVIAARPSVGKTTFALNLIHDFAVHQKQPVALFSLEMGQKEIGNNLICMDASIDSDLWRNKTRSLEENDRRRLGQTFDQLSKAPILIDDEAYLTPAILHAKLRRYLREHKIKAAFVDYMQQMSSPEYSKENRAQEISHISRSLKRLAREFSIPIIAMAQLNRAVEGRSDKKPHLADLRESGSIEQDADVVMLLHPMEEYDINERSVDIDVIVAKHRNGKRGTAKLHFERHMFRFENPKKI